MSASTTDRRYSFVPLDEVGFEIYASWFAAADAKHWVTPPTRQLLDYIQTSPSAHAWLVHTDGVPMAFVQMDAEPGQHGSLAIFVKPSERGLGHGRQILRALLERPEVAHLLALEAFIEPENVASLRCCLAAGFVQTSATPDADGLLKLEYRLAV
jgi:L-amino acid N-acyltransferase YncA